MRIAAGTVSCDGYGQTRNGDIENRLNLYELLVEQASKREIDLICFPGGYLRASDEKHKKELAEHLLKKAKKHNIAIAVGIDIGDKLISKKRKNDKKNGKAYAVCWSPEEDKLHCWLQRSRTSKDYKEELKKNPEKVHEYREEHILKIRNGSVEILVCGEIFNCYTRKSIIDRRDDINAMIDLAHESAGLRIARTMNNLAEDGVTSLCSVHTNRRRGMKYRYNPPGRRMSTRDFDNFDIPPEVTPRAEMKIWKI